MTLLIINSMSTIKSSPRPSPRPPTRQSPKTAPIEDNFVTQSKSMKLTKRKGFTGKQISILSFKNQLSSLKSLKFSFTLLLKIKSLKQKLIQQIKNSQKVFEVVDKNYDERTLYNVRIVKFYHENILFKNKLLKRIAARSIEFSTTQSVPSLYDSPKAHKSLT